MKREISVKHEFVQYIPDQLMDGTIYISIRFATVVHKCVCGCGNQVVTPLSPTDWQLIFDGETISLDPSIGNWSFGCQSHYWIRRNTVRWASHWSRKEIAAGRAQDRAAKAKHYDWAPRPNQRVEQPAGGDEVRATLWLRFQKWWRSK